MHLELIRDKAKVFPEVKEPLSVETLRLWHCSYRTLEPISDLTGLRGLIVASYPDSTFDPLSGLKDLEYLSVLHMPKIDAIAPISGLSRLRVLRLSTLPGWDASGRTTQVESLEGLARLSHLRHIELFGVLPRDGSLGALEGCLNLESVRVSKYPKAEVERFRRATGLSDAFAPEAWF